MTYQTVNPDVTSDDKLWGLLSYLLTPIVPAIILLMEDKKNRPFMRYHAIQALALFVIEFVLSAILIGVCVVPIYIIALIYYAIKAYQGELVVIPWLTDFMKKQGWLA